MNIQLFGQDFPPYYGKSKFYARKKENTLKKIAGLENKIATLKAVVEICDEKIAENEQKKVRK